MSKLIDLEIQQELRTITSMRPIPKEIQNKYDKIIKERIEPWIKQYNFIGVT